jgi:Domain of unknown function (DU1801)
MNDNKTKPSEQSVLEFLDTYPNQKVILDCKKLIKIFEDITKWEPVKWAHMVGFGTYNYKYASGREGNYFITGFAPSKIGITIYAHCDYNGLTEDIAELGKFKKGVGCIYIKSLADIDIKMLKKIITNCIKWNKKTYPKKIT